MGSTRLASSFDSLRRFALLNPCFLLAMAGAAAAARVGWTERPPLSLRSDRVAEVVGRIAGSPECGEDSLYFELRPESVRQGGRDLDLGGNIEVRVRSTQGDPCDALDPPLSYGERIRLRTTVTEPSYFAVPGVADFRDIQWLRGIAASARLKSPAQIERLPGPLPSFPQGPLFRYGEDFRRYCGRALSPTARRLVLGAFLGEKRILEPEERERIRSLGAFHLFVVSGFHVSLVLGVLHWMLTRLGWIGRVAGLALMWSYVAMTGAAPSAMRAGMMTSLFYLYLVAGLGRSALNCLGLTALLLLAWNPGLVFDAGFRFSFVALAAIGLLALPERVWIRCLAEGCADAWSRRLSLSPKEKLRRRVRFFLEEKLEFLPRPWCRGCCRVAGAILGFVLALAVCNVVVQLATLPLALFYSNRLVWTQGLSNLVLTPLFSGFVPACLLLFASFKTFLAGVPLAVVSICAEKVTVAMIRLDAISSTVWCRHPGGFLTLAYLLCLVAAFRLPAGGKRWLIAAGVPVGLFGALACPQRAETGWLQVTMLDVGQGEAFHLRYPNGGNALVDSGGLRSYDGSPTTFVGERLVGRYLWNEGVDRLDFVVLSHPHVDHIQGFQFLRRVFPVASLFYRDEDASYCGAKMVPMAGGDSFAVGGVEHRILHPPNDASSWSVNDGSLVVLLRYGRFSMLFTGDIEGKAERSLVAKLGPVTVLKVPHHGGATSCSERLLQASRPEAALISAGRRNPFGHPSKEALRRLTDADVAVFSTAALGSVRIETDGTIWRLFHYSTRSGRFERVMQRSL